MILAAGLALWLLGLAATAVLIVSHAQRWSGLVVLSVPASLVLLIVLTLVTDTGGLRLAAGGGPLVLAVVVALLPSEVGEPLIPLWGRAGPVARRRRRRAREGAADADDG